MLLKFVIVNSLFGGEAFMKFQMQQNIEITIDTIFLKRVFILEICLQYIYTKNGYFLMKHDCILRWKFEEKVCSYNISNHGNIVSHKVQKTWLSIVFQNLSILIKSSSLFYSVSFTKVSETWQESLLLCMTSEMHILPKIYPYFFDKNCQI